jgi:gamma-glutamyl hercynylcysteine S-oxide synthase
MKLKGVVNVQHTAEVARQADAMQLALALAASRRDTLATWAVFEQQLPSLTVPMQPTLNPPLWELGHIGWFQEFWIARNPQRHLGAVADPHAARSSPLRANAEALYDSSHVPHASRWQLPLPNAAATRDDLAQQLASTVACLKDSGADDAALYFFRLALLHEDMHHEAALYMAQSLGLAMHDARWQAQPLPSVARPVAVPAGLHALGQHGAGFAFDNELLGHRIELAAFNIDAQATRWAEFLPFVQVGGYTQPQWWCDAGAAWLAHVQPQAPRYLRQQDGQWQQWRHGAWCALDLRLPACHLTAFEAEAWCRWAGRRLPTEAEWEAAATAQPDAFNWGQVWEWTASSFAPYAGFQAHPYRDYSAPWFGGQHRVLRGASFMTQARLHDVRYRNFFLPTRNDVAAGFRSCAR